MNKVLTIGMFAALMLTMMAACAQIEKPKAEASDHIHEVLEVNTYLTQLKAETRPYHFVDVRTPAEVADGTIEGAVNIDYKASDFEQKMKALDNSQPIYLFCRSGNRSSKAAKFLLDSGYKEIYDLKGGYLKYASSQVQ